MPPRDTRRVETILARFPGPVTLYVGRRKKLFAFALCLAFAAFMAWLVVNPRGERLLRPYWYDTTMVWVSLVVFGGMSIRAVLLLLWPRSASLTLDVDAFEIGRVFRPVRLSWCGVGDFRVDETGKRSLTVMYEVLGLDTGSRNRSKAVKHFPDNYRLPKEDLAWLLNEWRRRALERAAGPGQEHTA